MPAGRSKNASLTDIPLVNDLTIRTYNRIYMISFKISSEQEKCFNYQLFRYWKYIIHVYVCFACRRESWHKCFSCIQPEELSCSLYQHYQYCGLRHKRVESSDISLTQSDHMVRPTRHIQHLCTNRYLYNRSLTNVKWKADLHKTRPHLLLYNLYIVFNKKYFTALLGNNK